MTSKNLKPANAAFEKASIVIQAALEGDQDVIVALIQRERVNPHGIHWQNFVIAKDGTRLIGAAQLRHHKDGSRELGSLVVVPDRRGAGLAGRLIETLLQSQAGPVHMVTGRAHAEHYARWGFEPVRPPSAPYRVRQNYYLGQLIGGAHALLTWRPVNRLVILRREAVAANDHPGASGGFTGAGSV